MATYQIPCENCGTEWERDQHPDEVTIHECAECCDHENTHETLTGEVCENCGKSL
jgi:hypothetical protein